MTRNTETRPAPTLLSTLQEVELNPPIADQITFRSPAADYHGRADVLHVLHGIASVVRETGATSVIIDGPWRLTTLTGRISEYRVQGVLRERADRSGRIVEAELYLRPYAALREGVNQMRALMEREPLPSEADASEASRGD
jgi:hypothetical protein